MHNERKRHRLANWDYSSEGVYCVTICCQGKETYFGSISKNKVILTDIGVISSENWLSIPVHFPHVMLDEFVIMPNHIHGILVLKRDKVLSNKNQVFNSFSHPVKDSLSVIVNQYKSSVKRWCNKNEYKYFSWQSGYYDQIIRNEISLEKIREYISLNPHNWVDDGLYK